MKGSVLVVGAGPAGMRATAELLQQGFKVFMLETRPTIGGKMAQIDKVFPTNECSTCTILPRMLELTSDPNIAILAHCDVLGLDGEPGNFKVRVLKKPRYVDPMKCTACTDCFPACPVGGVPMEFNFGRGASKAISFYSPFPPRKAIIHADRCDQLVKGKCGDKDVPPCVEACKPGAIDFDQKPVEMEIEVGAVIVSAGMDEKKDKELREKFAHGDNPNVLTALEYERLLSGLGPTGGVIKRDDGKAPGSVSWLALDGASPVCFMTAVAQAMGTVEKIPGAKVRIFRCETSELRGPYEDFLQLSRDCAIEYIQCEPGRNVQVTGGSEEAVTFTVETTEGEMSTEADMLVLVPPLTPPEGLGELAGNLGIDLDEDGSIRKGGGGGHPTMTSRDGIFVCGTAGGVAGIDDSVVQACSAAADAAALLTGARDTETVARPEWDLKPVEPGDGPRTAVIICRCGANIAGLLDLEELLTYVRSLPGVKTVEATPFGCDGVLVKELLATGEYNRLVMGACSPKTHEPLFMLHTVSGGLNPHLMEIVNIRNHCTWVHSEDREGALEKAKMLMKMGVSRANLLEPLDDIEVPVTDCCLVVGGTPAGVACALRLAEMGHEAHLVVSGEGLGVVEGEQGPFIQDLVKRLESNDKVTVHTGTKVAGVEGFIGNFKAKLASDGGEAEMDAGAVVIATRENMGTGADGAGYEKDLMLARGERDHFIGALGILNPLDFNTEGVFRCGSARLPMDDLGSVVDGEGAASRVACILSKDRMVKSPRVSSVVDANCDGCAYCVEPCPAQAITLIEYQREGAIKKTVQVNEAICKGCGLCMATCPKLGILIRHFTQDQFSVMIDAYGGVS